MHGCDFNTPLLPFKALTPDGRWRQYADGRVELVEPTRQQRKAAAKAFSVNGRRRPGPKPSGGLKYKSKGRSHRGVDAVCEHCGKRFVALAQSVRRGYGRFCSISCSSAHKGFPRRSAPPGTEQQQYEAHYAINDAIRRGVLERPSKCDRCGKTCKAEGHHEDYAKPHDVTWLCHGCHMRRHHELAKSA